MYSSLAAPILLVITLAATPTSPPPVAYPEGYRAFSHVKSLLLKPNHALANPFAGLHHTYANDKAVRGLKSGKYEDGAIFAFDLLDYKDEESSLSEGKRKLLGVMERNAKKYSATGGWGFEGFSGDSKTERLVKDGGVGCFTCHQAQQAKSFVFSEWRQ